MDHSGSTQTSDTASRRSYAWVWGVALVVVIVAWMGAIALRGGGGEKVELVGWQQGLDPGQAKATERDRPMLIMFTADWCVPCQKLKRDLLKQPTVSDKLQAEWVPVVVDMTDARANDPRLERFGIKSYPTLVLMAAQGDELGRVTDTRDKRVASTDAFLDWLDQAMQP